MHKEIGIGIVGTGFAGSFHAGSWSRVAGAVPVAVAGRNREKCAAFGDRYGIRRKYGDFMDLVLDPEVDVVDICTPNYTHAALAIAAMEHGKDVICEKPVATTVSDGRRIVDARRETGRRFFYAEDWLFAPALVRAVSLVAEGAIGSVLYVKAKESHAGSHSPDAQRIATCGGGSLMHLGIHPAGFLQGLLGEPKLVTGSCSGGGELNILHKSLEGEDWGVALLEYANGARAVIEGNYITPGGMDDSVELYGSSGVIKVDMTFGSPLRVYSREGFAYAIEKADTTKGWTRPAVDEHRSLGYPDELAAFAACIRGEAPQPRGSSAEDGLSALRAIDAAYRSNREGRPVQF